MPRPQPVMVPGGPLQCPAPNPSWYLVVHYNAPSPLDLQYVFYLPFSYFHSILLPHSPLSSLEKKKLARRIYRNNYADPMTYAATSVFVVTTSRVTPSPSTVTSCPVGSAGRCRVQRTSNTRSSEVTLKAYSLYSNPCTNPYCVYGVDVTCIAMVWPVTPGSFKTGGTSEGLTSGQLVVLYTKQLPLNVGGCERHMKKASS